MHLFRLLNTYMVRLHKGDRFGRLTVLSPVEIIRTLGTRYLSEIHCICSCGAEKFANKYSLMSGKTRSCGCLGKLRDTKGLGHHNSKDITGQKFSSLSVISLADSRSSDGGMKYNCLCGCGNNCVVARACLISGMTKSCGCHRRVRGQNNKGYLGYKDLGQQYWGNLLRGAKARNIYFCVEKEQAYELFIKQEKKCALTGVPLNFKSCSTSKDGTASLDRKDSKKGYTIDNVQWIHKIVNKMKNNLPEREFLDWCELISTHRKRLEANPEPQLTT
jgi:hypothetical protein